MNLKKRLTVTFITLTFLPIILTAVTFAFLCGVVAYNEDNTEFWQERRRLRSWQRRLIMRLKHSWESILRGLPVLNIWVS